MVRFLLKSAWYFLLMVVAAMFSIYIGVSIAIGHEIVDKRIAEIYHAHFDRHEMSQEKAK